MQRKQKESLLSGTRGVGANKERDEFCYNKQLFGHAGAWIVLKRTWGSSNSYPCFQPNLRPKEVKDH